MLVLSRKIGEDIVIKEGDRVLAVITITDIKYSKCCKLGVIAPQEVRVYRRELLEKMQGTPQ